MRGWSSTIHTAIGTFYDAASGAAPWDAAGDVLRRITDARTVSLSVWNPMQSRVQMLCTNNVDDAAWAQKAYLDRFHVLDRWTHEGLRIARRDGGRPCAVPGHLLVPEHEYRESEFYQDFARRLGIFHIIGAPVALGRGAFAPLGLHRPEGDRRFTDSEVRRVNFLLPHLRSALQLNLRLQTDAVATQIGRIALEAMQMAAVVVDADLRVSFANTVAESLAASGSGLQLRRIGASAGGKIFLGAANHPDEVRLRALVRSVAILGAAGGVLRFRAPSDTKQVDPPILAGLVCPLPRSLCGHEISSGIETGNALLLVRYVSRKPRLPASLLAEFFDLTSTEAAVATELLGGMSADVVAAGRGVALSTVRGHIRVLLSKAGAVNLRDFERLAASLPYLEDKAESIEYG